ncbi:translation initiation factor aIF-1 (SUI1 protein, bacterial-type IF3) [Natronomonas pharaonis DSM 2160]|uniref:Translation initiation factor aIF-1 (SUI1 protein, bacterial-type IF3) n=1 Tax=Natronomonas pharaonis (strain ATCC 35678 / DSM 2160 / CIP 103997 / JCM 8858 / NBRC 14720 / NCIMB 2260 / Gabara) TaxID=348780 RepID=A0A1U7EXJ1_NATPD|nr:translation initiation factor aIF-1 (SUI1 protein, bacterial-type IF3) [Natronomonas pharaonis DSM 2160]
MTDDDSMEDLLAELDSHSDLSKAGQALRIRTEKRQYGKAVTIIEGFDTTATDVQSLASDLKSELATGGTSASDSIELQGDHTGRLPSLLEERGFEIVD